MFSIISWRDAEEWLEGLWSSGASAGDGPAQIRTQSTVKSCRGNAPEHGEDKGTEKGWQGHLGASELTMHADSAAAHWRGIATAWRRFDGGEGKERRTRGFIGAGEEAELVGD
jgi:hypothetical protein